MQFYPHGTPNGAHLLAVDCYCYPYETTPWPIPPRCAIVCGWTIETIVAPLQMLIIAVIERFCVLRTLFVGRTIETIVAPFQKLIIAVIEKFWVV